MYLLWLLAPSVMAQDNSLILKPSPKDTAKVQDLLRQGQEAELTSTGGWLNALNYYGKAYQLAQVVNDRVGEAASLRLIAILESRTGSHEKEVIQYFLQELAIREEIGDSLETANTYTLLGDFFDKKLHLTQEAIGYYKHALILREKSSASDSLLRVSYLKLGQLWAELGNKAQAESYFERAIQQFVHTQRFYEASELCLDVVAYVSLPYEDFLAAQKWLRQAQKYHQQAQRYDFTTYPQTQKRIQSLTRELEEDQQKRQQAKNQQRAFILIGGLVLLICGGLIWYFKRQSQVQT